MSNCIIRDSTTTSPSFSIFFVVDNNPLNQIIDKLQNTWTFFLLLFPRGEKSHNLENFTFPGVIVVNYSQGGVGWSSGVVVFVFRFFYWWFLASWFIFVLFYFVPVFVRNALFSSFRYTYLLLFSLMTALYYHYANTLSHIFPPQKQSCVSPYHRIFENLRIVSLIYTIIQIHLNVPWKTHKSLLIARNYSQNFTESQLHLQNKYMTHTRIHDLQQQNIIHKCCLYMRNVVIHTAIM